MSEIRNPHPGEIMKEEFLNEIGMSQNQLAEAIGVPRNRIHAIVNGTRDITANTDLRLCRFFELSEGYFLRLQNAYDMLQARRRISDDPGYRLRRKCHPLRRGRPRPQPSGAEIARDRGAHRVARRTAIGGEAG